MVISMSNQATGGPTGWSRYATAYPKIQRTKAHPGIGDRACRRLRSDPRLVPGGSPHAEADAPKALTSPTSGSLRADAASVRPSPNSLSSVLASHPAAPLTARHHPLPAPHAGRLVFLPAAAVPLAPACSHAIRPVICPGGVGVQLQPHASHAARAAMVSQPTPLSRASS